MEWRTSHLSNLEKGLQKYNMGILKRKSKGALSYTRCPDLPISGLLGEFSRLLLYPTLPPARLLFVQALPQAAIGLDLTNRTRDIPRSSFFHMSSSQARPTKRHSFIVPSFTLFEGSYIQLHCFAPTIPRSPCRVCHRHV